MTGTPSSAHTTPSPPDPPPGFHRDQPEARPLVVQPLRLPGQIDHEEAAVGSQVQVLGFDDHPAPAVPRLGPVDELPEEPLLLVRPGKLSRRDLRPGAGQLLQHCVAGQTEEIAHIVSVAPTHQLPTAKAAVAAKEDPHVSYCRRKRFTSSFKTARLCLAPSIWAGRRYAASNWLPQKTWSGKKQYPLFFDLVADVTSSRSK